METILYPSQENWGQYLERPVFDQQKIEKIVKPILDKVKRGGDQALFKFALEYDQVSLDNLFVEKELLQ